MSGLCECGCGGTTRIAARTDRRKGWVKGQPLRYLPQHHRVLSPVQYIVDPETGCWTWQRTKTHNGYPVIYFEGKERAYAHRFFYERERGPIPDGLQLDHLCRNRACVNPAHLEPVTGAENRRRGNGTLLTVEAVREIRQAAGTRAEIGRRFGISPGYVTAVRTRRRWADVA